MTKKLFHRVGNTIKAISFWVVILGPMALLLTVILDTSYIVYKLRNVPPQKVVEDIRHIVERKKGRTLDIVENDGVPGFYRKYTDERTGSYFIPIAQGPKQKLIYVFGGSSVVQPDYDHSFGFELETLLNQGLGTSVKVINFGVPGLDSYSVKNRVKTAVGFRRPDLVIVYTGHNDFTINLGNHLGEHYPFVKDSPFLRPFFSFLYRNGWVLTSEWSEREVYEMGFQKYLQHVVEPVFFKALLKMGLLNLNNVFEKAYPLVLEGYKRNIGTIIETTGENGVPLILMTPIANLEVPPLGIDQKAVDLFDQGISEKDYSKRIALLKQARDAEVFNSVIRAKTPLLAFLRSINQPNVTLLDLDKDLTESGFSFGWDAFWDHVHFTQSTHELIAQRLVQVYKNISPDLGSKGRVDPDNTR